MPSDLVVTVRQIGNYPATTAASSGDNLLMQAGGPGAPYWSISAADLVATALQGGPAMGIGLTPPANADGGLFTGTITAPADGAIAWNAYLNNGDWRLLTPGSAASIGWDQTSGLDFAVSTAGSAQDPLTWVSMLRLDNAGNLGLPYGTIGVARDPAANNEVVTLNYLRNNTVSTFNNRNGAVQLNAQDVYNALKLCDPIATQPWVEQAITNSLQNLMYTCPFVNTWNGRKGQVYLMLSDISCVFMQPGQQPITQTPPPASNDDSIANTRWVTSLVAQFDAAANLSVINVLNHGAMGDGVTDDTQAIQNVLNNFAGRAIVFIPDTRRPYMVSGITLPNGTDLLLLGVLMLRPDTIAAVVTADNVGHFTIRGSGVIDGNKVAQTTPNPGFRAGLAINQCANALVTGITIQNAYWWNLNVTGSSNIKFHGISLWQGNAANEFAAGSSECWITNSWIDGTNNHDYAFCFYGGVTSSGIIGCTVKNAGAGTSSAPPGIGVLSDDAASYTQPPCSNIVIADNIISDCNGPGLSCIYVSTPVGAQSGIMMSNNRVVNSSMLAVSEAGAGIFIDNTTDITVTGNQISGSGSNVPGQVSCGIFLGPNSKNVSLKTNTIYNVGAPGSNSAGVWDFNSANLFMSGNNIYDDQASSSMQNAMIGGAGPGSVITDNYSALPFVINGPGLVLANYTPGGLSINPGRLAVSAPIGILNASNIPRWYVGNALNPETGGNTGSDFVIDSVADDNSHLLGNPILIRRATGDVTFSGSIFAANLAVDVTAHGARGDGTTDDAAAIQAAANAAAGRTLYFPPATYLIGTPVHLSSGTTVMAYGATIVPSPGIASLPDSSNPALGSGLGPVMFTNLNWQATALTDHDIKWFGGTLGPLTGSPRLACHALFFRMVTNVVIQDATAQLLNDCFALLACTNTVMERCLGLDYMNCAFDHWDGAMNATVRDCEARGGQSGLTTNGVLFNTDSTVTGHSSGVAANCLIDNVRIYDCDQAFSFGPLVAGPTCDDCAITNCYCTGGTYGIVFSGVTGGRIENNVIAANNANPLVIGIAGDVAHPSSRIVVTGNRFENCHPTGGAYIQALGPQMTIAHNKAANSTAYFAVWVDDPTTVVMPNYLPGYTIFLLNQTSQGGATTPAMELLADSTHNPGCTISTGSAVPSDIRPAGSIYLHAGGASGARLYVSAGGGTWNAVAGV